MPKHTVCHLSNAIHPPAQAGSPKTLVYMILQPAGRTADDVTTTTGGLLPHLLTLIPTSRDGYFLLRYHTLTNISSFRSAVPFVVRTFLPGFIRGDRPACFRRKDKTFFNWFVRIFEIRQRINPKEIALFLVSTLYNYWISIRLEALRNANCEKPS